MELPKTNINKNTEEDYKTEEDLENMEEINPNLLKIIEKHHDKITSITNTINVSELIGYISFLVFLLMLTIRLAPDVSYNWLILLAPALTCIIAFTVLLNAYLKLKDLFDESEDFELEKTNNSLGSVLSYFCLNTASLCVIAYLVLLSLKLQNLLSINFNEIAIPLYVLYGIATFYYIFIFPAFIKNKLIFPLFMFGLYLIASFVFFVLLNMKLDKNMQGYFTLVFISMLISILFHMVCYGYLLVTSTKNNFLNNVSILIALALMLSALLLVGLKLDSLVSIDIWVPLVLVIFAYTIIVSDKLYAFFDKSGNGNKNEQYLSNNHNSNYDSEKHF